MQGEVIFWLFSAFTSPSFILFFNEVVHLQRFWFYLVFLYCLIGVWFVVDLLLRDAVRCLVAMFYLYEDDSDGQSGFDRSKYGRQYIEELDSYILVNLPTLSCL